MAEAARLLARRAHRADDLEQLVPLELVKLGVPKEKLAAMNTVMLPVSMATQACVSRYFVEGALTLTSSRNISSKNSL